MKIHQQFTGGNIRILSHQGNTVALENELRDTAEDWFYWAFCVEDAQNTTLTFQFGPNRLGYFGPAISHDLKNWHWLTDCCQSENAVRPAFSYGENSFTYHFGPEESKVYFAHSMLYHPDRFYSLAKSKNLSVQTLCQSKKGRPVPCLTFGQGPDHLILTARHHACESTGNYVLEGFLDELLSDLPDSLTVFCVPFVDLDGVLDGDQGKSRAPYDHNRDYDSHLEAIYPETAAIRAYADQHGCRFGFDFHSPWHISGQNDTVFVVQNSHEKLPQLTLFGKLLESRITPDSLQYSQTNDYPPDTGWNRTTTPSCGNYLNRCPKNEFAFSLETTYFGTAQNQVTQEKMTALGRCAARALRVYIDSCSSKI